MLVFALLLTACGGGNEVPPMNRPIQKPKLSQDDYEGATEIYARGVETGDIEMIRRVLAPDEQDKLGGFEENFKRSDEEEVSWRIEYPTVIKLDDERVAVQVVFHKTEKGGEEKADQGSWLVFILQDDKWFYSPKTTESSREEIMRAYRAMQGEEDENPEDGDTPGDGEEPAGDDGAEDGDSSEAVE
jgi:hypothetical protein